MKEIEFLLEEPGMKNALEILLPKIMPKGYELNVNVFLRPHNGKSDLKASIPKKVKAFSNPILNKKVVIMIDMDNNDCKELKQSLQELVTKNGTGESLIRIVCRELEGWYLGDMPAIQKAYPQFKARKYLDKEKFRNPNLAYASVELSKIIPDFQKGQASRSIPLYMNVSGNKNHSFNAFVAGLRSFMNN